MKTAFDRHFSFLLLAAVLAFPLAALADGGRIRFEGAVVEPVCSVQTPTVNLTTDSLKQRSNKKQVSKADTFQMQVNCNADQAVQISFDDIRPHAGSQFSSSVEGVEISLTHKGKQITPGDSVSYAFHGKQDTSVPMMAALQRTAGSNAADAVPSKVRGAILVSFNYR